MNDGILCYSHPERRLRTERESVEEWTTILELSHFGLHYAVTDDLFLTEAPVYGAGRVTVV